ncbi:MAG: hypothetical protein MZV70_50515 [Desulfobacterales bacterium]|nr:hypothetical protein [Desulfobacterales bacterium]
MDRYVKSVDHDWYKQRIVGMMICVLVGVRRAGRAADLPAGGHGRGLLPAVHEQQHPAPDGRPAPGPDPGPQRHEAGREPALLRRELHAQGRRGRRPGAGGAVGAPQGRRPRTCSRRSSTAGAWPPSGRCC